MHNSFPQIWSIWVTFDNFLENSRSLEKAKVWGPWATWLYQVGNSFLSHYLYLDWKIIKSAQIYLYCPEFILSIFFSWVL